MRVTVKIHQPIPSTHLPAHEHAARRRRVKTERPVASAGSHPRRQPTPPAPLNQETATRKSAETRFHPPSPVIP